MNAIAEKLFFISAKISDCLINILVKKEKIIGVEHMRKDKKNFYRDVLKIVNDFFSKKLTLILLMNSQKETQFDFPAFQQGDSLGNQCSWREIQVLLKNRLGEFSFNRFFKDAEVIFSKVGLYHIKVEEKKKFWIEEHYEQRFREIICEVFGWQFCELEIETFSAEKEKISNSKEKKKIQSLSLQEALLKKSGLSTQKFLDNFFVSPENGTFFKIVEDFEGSNTEKSNPPIFIYGSSGSGKTHLLHTLGRSFCKKFFSVRYTSAENFVNNYVSSVISKKGLSEFRMVHRETEVLFVDDFQFFRGEKSQKEFLHTLEDLMMSGSLVVICANSHFSSFQNLNSPLKEKLKSSAIFEMKNPSPFEVRKILKQKMFLSKINLDEASIDFIAHNLPNLGQIEGIFYKLYAFKEMLKKEETFSLRDLKNLLSVYFEEDRKSLPLSEIKSKIAEFYHLPEEEILGQRRTQKIVSARQVGMYFSRLLTRNSLIDIGSAFGGRDHATVLYACKRIDEKMESDKQFSLEIESLKKEILFLRDSL